MNFPELPLHINNILENSPELRLLYACIADAVPYIDPLNIFVVCQKMIDQGGYVVDINYASMEEVEQQCTLDFQQFYLADCRK